LTRFLIRAATHANPCATALWTYTRYRQPVAVKAGCQNTLNEEKALT